MWHPLVWQIHSVGIALFAMGDPAQAASGSGLMAYNTRVVLLGTMFLGMCSGVIGTFMLLRKKALVGDVASHAALPGIGIAYLVVESITPGYGKSLPWLLVI